MKRRLWLFLLAALLVIGCLPAFTSCNAGGAVGISSAEINEKGELVLIHTNGTEQNLGVVVGKDGADGVDGTNGKDGVDGEDGASGSGSVVISGAGSNIPAASSKGLRSAVSIVCYFESTVQQGGWRPGSGGTTTKEYASGGAGVIYKMDEAAGDAFIITNYHVVYDASSNTENGISDDIRVYLYGAENEESAIEATYVGGSLYYDIAVLRVEDSEELKNSAACAVTVADSDKVAVGDTAIAIGNAQGYGISASFGIVSVDSEYITMTAADGKTTVSIRVLRVDTAINSGNSGGGLYDERGNLIGIVNAKEVADGVENIGYSIPSNIATSIADNIIDYCYEKDNERVYRALLGITVSAADSRSVYDAETGLISIEETVSVYEVSEGSLADGVLREGDVFLSVSVNGIEEKITRQYHIIDLMLDMRVGDTLTLQMLRDGETVTVEITVTEECLTAY